LLNERGATLLMVLVLVVILGLGAGMAGSTWKTVMQREREKELLFRGDQYRRAIESYAKSAHGNQRQQQRQQQQRQFGRGPANYPAELEDLLKDNRSLATVRHLRKLYKDPLTGEDFELIKDPAGRIKGVRSTSTEEPFKKDRFAPAYVNFKDAKAYRDWEFVFEPGQDKSTNTTRETKITFEK
jgi:type II secretory pathway pseudopilin PulG